MGKKVEVKPGDVFGRLTIKEVLKIDGVRMAACKCSCGNIKVVAIRNLLSGHTKSCGCLLKDGAIEHNTKHGYSKHPAYNSYKSMMSRCYHKSNRSYKNYGGRGITVCDAWKDHPEVFCVWADKNGFRKGLTIDRINTFGNYCPENCRWITNKAQQRNRRDNVRVRCIETGVVYETIKEASDDIGVCQSNISACIKGEYLSAGKGVNGEKLHWEKL